VDVMPRLLLLVFRLLADTILRLHRTAQRRFALAPSSAAVVAHRTAPATPATPQRTPLIAAPRLQPGPRKLLVLDLDETLVHSTQHWSTSCSFTIRVAKPPPPPPQPTSLDDSLAPYTPSKHGPGRPPQAAEHVVLFVSKRPHLDVFLRKVNSWYDVAVLTSSSEAYASLVLDKLDRRRKLLRRRYYRSSCIETADGAVHKDLRVLTDDLSRVLLVDNSAAAFAFNAENVLPITSWLGDDPEDEALLDLLPFLFALRFVHDVRSILGLRLLFAP